MDEEGDIVTQNGGRKEERRDRIAEEAEGRKEETMAKITRDSAKNTSSRGALMREVNIGGRRKGRGEDEK